MQNVPNGVEIYYTQTHCIYLVFSIITIVVNAQKLYEIITKCKFSRGISDVYIRLVLHWLPGDCLKI